MGNDHTAQESILIVDDTPDNLSLLTKLLTDRGYKVRAAPSGAHALRTIKKELPDLILLDVMMPQIDGYEVCRRLKEDDQTSHVPVIFLSALDDPDKKIDGFEAGGVDYITKPFHEKEVIQRVKTHLEIHHLQRNLQAESARFKTLTEAAFEGILIHDKGEVIDVNPEAARVFACRERDLIGANLEELVPANIRELLLSDQPFVLTCEITHEDQVRIPVEIRSKNVPVKDQQVLAIRDLSLQKKIEEEKQQLQQENTALKVSMQDRYKFGGFIGRSPAMQVVYETISKAAASEFPIVIYGESGTGKELAAQTVHALSGRQQKPFITVNCGALAESIFERELFGHRRGAFTDATQDEPGFLDVAHGGTLFLDELGELSMAMQVKLLRVLESGEYIPVGDVTVRKADVRIIVATNRDLAELVHQGKFREDLFYRIQVITITLPPLRERKEDIRLLVDHILSQHHVHDRSFDLPDKLREMLYQYDWPGNVRELINTIQRFLVTDVVSLPGHVQNHSDRVPPLETGLRSAVESLEKKMIKEALERTNWRRGKTAELLQIPRRSLLRKMQKYDLRPDQEPDSAVRQP